MRNITVFSFIGIITLTTLAGCKVETSTEKIPEAEGKGKTAINLRLETMSKDEIKNAADKTIDSAAQFVEKARDAATSATHNAKTLTNSVTTITQTIQAIKEQVGQ